MADIELHALLLCDYALTAQDGKISAIGIFSQINVTRLPAIHGRFFIVAVVEADAGAHDLQLGVLSPSGDELLGGAPSLTMQVPPNATTANIVADLNGLEVKELGRHRVELRAGQRLLGSASFNVNLLWQTDAASA